MLNLEEDGLDCTVNRQHMTHLGILNHVEASLEDTSGAYEASEHAKSLGAPHDAFEHSFKAGLDDTSAAHDALPLLEVAADGDANGEEEEGEHDPNFIRIISLIIFLILHVWSFQNKSLQSMAYPE
jgi:hypothetical protein